MQSRDWRLLIAQVQREARELPVRTSIDKLAKVIGERNLNSSEKRISITPGRVEAGTRQERNRLRSWAGQLL